MPTRRRRPPPPRRHGRHRPRPAHGSAPAHRPPSRQTFTASLPTQNSRDARARLCLAAAWRGLRKGSGAVRGAWDVPRRRGGGAARRPPPTRGGRPSPGDRCGERWLGRRCCGGGGRRGERGGCWGSSELRWREWRWIRRVTGGGGHRSPLLGVSGQPHAWPCTC